MEVVVDKKGEPLALHIPGLHGKTDRNTPGNVRPMMCEISQGLLQTHRRVNVLLTWIPRKT
jgi:hypothetical protein